MEKSACVRVFDLRSERGGGGGGGGGSLKGDAGDPAPEEREGSRERYIGTQGDVVLGWEPTRNLSFEVA